MSTVRVLIADDHALVRAGFRGLLQGLGGVEVVAEAADGREAWTLIRSLRPDIALLDISMPGLNGLELSARIKSEQPSTRVIMLSMHAGEEYVLRAVRVGASGYLLKDTSPDELHRAVHAVAAGETYFDGPSVKMIVANLQRGGNTTDQLEILTPRQREVLQLIGEGNSTKEIASLLEISVKTAEAHRTQLMARLDIHDLASVVRYAIRVGLVDPNA